MRIRMLLIAVAAAGAVATAAPADAAPVFDEPGYSTCTATTPPGPDGNVDTVVNTCCANHGGVPEPTRFGMGCAAAAPDTADPDYRPTIVLPMRSDPNLPDESDLEELEKQPPLPPPP
jgi:hypothetical protein